MAVLEAWCTERGVGSRLSVPVRRRGRRTLGLCVCLLAASAAPAGAAVTHQFLPEVSTKLTEGVPAGSGAALTGPLLGVNALAGDAGSVWAAEEAGNGTSRVDRFDAASGSFVAPQLNEEAEVRFLQAGVAVGHATGEEEVYVGASREGENVLAVFGPSGKLQSAWAGAHTPEGRFAPIAGVAVDASTFGDPNAGDVFVAGNSGVIDIFTPSPGGAEPGETVGQVTASTTATGSGTLTEGSATIEAVTTTTGEFSVGQQIEAAGIPAETTITAVSASSLEISQPATASGSASLSARKRLEPHGVVVSPVNGDLLVSDGPEERCASGDFTDPCQVDVFEPTSIAGVYSFAFAITGAPHAPFERLGPMAVDPTTGNIYVVEKQLNVVDEFDSAGAYRGHLTGTPSAPFHLLRSVAVEPTTGHVFVGDFDPTAQRGAIDAFGPDLTIPDVETQPPTEVTPQAAQLNGTVALDEAGPATCRFVWGTSGAFGQAAACVPSDLTAEETAVHAKLENLEPDTTYVYRLQATNANGTNPGEPFQNQSFTTPGPGLHGEWASDVTARAATLNAIIDPHGEPTSFFFEYGTTTGYGASSPQPPAAIGSEQEAHAETHVQGLEPGRLYHYRVVRVSALGAFPGPDRTFTTPTLATGSLPDARQWELVSPQDKHGAYLEPIGEFGVIQSSLAGDAVSYVGTVPVEAQPQGYSDTVQILSTRSPEGWVSKDIALPHATPSSVSAGRGPEYRFFSPDLSQAAIEPMGGEFTSLVPEAFPPDSERTPYVRHDATCAQATTTCFAPLLTTAPGYADVIEGAGFGNEQEVFVDASPDLAHAIVTSDHALTETPAAQRGNLYEWTATAPPTQRLQLVSIAADDHTPVDVAYLGAQNENTRHAISEDGSRVVWAEGEGEHHLFMRDTVKERTIELDAPQAECAAKGECGEGAPAPVFQIASADGARVFFTDTQRLTADSGRVPGESDLYECEMTETGGELQCVLHDLTPAPKASESADVQNTVLGASEDGSWVYFVANGVLAEGAAAGSCRGQSSPPGGVCNLYAMHFDGTRWETPRLVAILSGQDFPDWAGGSSQLNVLTARVSPNGRWLAFMSQRELTGYDNHDVSTGKPDEEVYVYDALGSGGAGRLACASCDRSGARPSGVEYATINRKLAGGDRVWPGEQGIAANIPGWTPFKQLTARHQSRYLSNDGRLFFNSSDALVSTDGNRNEDVYEFEPAGIGGCSTASETFSGGSGGCVSLISSGAAAGESAFLDASESGDDAFFLTSAQLAPQDADTAFDLYDAHVCSAAAPCVTPTPPPPPCATADACRAAPSPQPSIFAAPASSTFAGPGNLAIAPPRALTRRQQLAKALASCRKKDRRARRRRIACERKARRRYGSRRRTRG